MKHLSLILLATCCIFETTLAQETEPTDNTQKTQPAEKPSAEKRPSNAPPTNAPPSNAPPSNAAPTNAAPTNAAPTDAPPPKRQPPSQQGSSTSGVDKSDQQADDSDTSSEDSDQPPEKSSGRRLSKLKPLKTISGSIPGYMMRASQANSDQSGSQNQQQSGGRRNLNGLTSSQQSSLQQIFLKNSMLFDSNGDSLLAANELKDLFLLLISQNNVTNNNSTVNSFGYATQTSGQTQYGQANQNSSSSSSSSNRQSTNSTQSRSQSLAILLAGSIPAIQGTDLQDATLLFLLLTMQFDTNNDGALDQQELRRFATALLNNDLNLTQVTQQVQQQR